MKTREAAVRRSLHASLPLTGAILVLAGASLAAGCLSVRASKSSASSGDSRSGASDASAKSETLPTVSEKTERLEKLTGLLTLYRDRAKGKLWLEVPPPGPRGVAGRFIYVDALVSGLGSSPVGLDRGQLGDSRIVALRRVGPRVLVEQENLRYRALDAPPSETDDVRPSFAASVLWVGEAAVLDPDGRALVDFTSFVVRDAHGVAVSLKAAWQGTFSLDPARSALELDTIRAFPDNVELQASLTFAGQEPGPLVR